MAVTAVGKELEKRDEGMDYVFVGDVSGSMGDDGKLALSQGSVRAFLAELGGQRLELVPLLRSPGQRRFPELVEKVVDVLRNLRHVLFENVVGMRLVAHQLRAFGT